MAQEEFQGFKKSTYIIIIKSLSTTSTYVVVLFYFTYTAQCELLMHTTGWVQLNCTIPTMFNYHLASVKALEACNRGKVHPCCINVHGVTCVAA